MFRKPPSLGTYLVSFLVFLGSVSLQDLIRGLVMMVVGGMLVLRGCLGWCGCERFCGLEQLHRDAEAQYNDVFLLWRGNHHGLKAMQNGRGSLRNSSTR
jgi:hypothetical protein